MSLAAPSFAPPSSGLRRLRVALARPIGPAQMTGLAAAAAAAIVGLILVRAALAGLWFRPPQDGKGMVDFAEFWGAGRMVLHGRAADAYEWVRLRAEISRGLGAQPYGSLPFRYPPPMLVLLAPLGALPYAAAFEAWTALALVAYLLAVRGVSRHWTALAPALAAPGVLATLTIGQNGLFTAALLGGGLALLDRRPLAAGALLGVLCVKPQLAVLVPVARSSTAVVTGVVTGVVAPVRLYGPAFSSNFSQPSER